MARGSRYGINGQLIGPGVIEQLNYIDQAKAKLHVEGVVPYPFFTDIAANNGAPDTLPSEVLAGDLIRIVMEGGTTASDAYLIWGTGDVNDVTSGLSIDIFSRTLPTSDAVTGDVLGTLSADTEPAIAAIDIGDIIDTGTGSSIAATLIVTNKVSNVLTVRTIEGSFPAITDDIIQIRKFGSFLQTAQVAALYMRVGTDVFTIVPPNAASFVISDLNIAVSGQSADIINPIAIEYTLDR